MEAPVIYNSNIKKQLMQQPEYARKIAVYKVKEIYKDEFFSNSAPTVFIGSKLKYPEVNVGILSPPEKKEDVWLYDAQKYWAENNFNINEILNLRKNLINSRFKTDVKAVRRSDTKFLELAREIGMSSKPVDTEFKLKKKIKLKIELDDVALPMGPRGNLSKLAIGNTKIPSKTDKVYNDIDLKAVEGIRYLNKHGYDEQKLTQLLSIGIMGLKRNRVLVPTRNSITAIDDTLSKELLKKIRDYSWLDEYQLFTGNYLGNYYFVMMFPEIMQFELFETYMPGSFWNPTMNIEMSHDYETWKGRTTYASNCAGGYYASRLPICEFLKNVKKQATVIVFRFELPEYWIGLGVFVVRESMRKTLKTQPMKFDTKEKLISKTKELIYNKFKFDITNTLKKSVLLETLNKQKKLFEF